MNVSIAVIITILFICTVLIAKYFNLLFKTPLNNFKYSSIEGLRGVLAFIVFIHHFVIWYNYIQTNNWDEPQSNLLNHFGKSGVSFFFMITGFLFTNKLIDKKTIHWRYFFINRVLRLVPLYFFSIICLIATVFIVSRFKLNEPIIDFIQQSSRWFLFTYIGSGDLNGLKDTFTINAGVVWTLAHEWFFYFTLPMLGFILFSKKVSYKVLLICLALVVLFIYKGDPLYFYFLYFIAGGLSTFTLSIIKDYKNLLKSKKASILVVILMVVNVYFFHNPDNIISTLINFIIFLIIAGGNSFFNILNYSGAQILGQLSYSIYILHGIVLYFLNTIIIKKKFLQSLTLDNYFYLSFIYITLIVILAFMTHKFIEKPFLNLRKKFTSHPS